MRIIPAVLILLMLFAGFSCAKDHSGEAELKISRDEDLAKIRPEKPVRIQLKRKENGTYSWEITGDDVEKIIAADRKLEKSLHTN
jgi:hypothetical protein